MVIKMTHTEKAIKDIVYNFSTWKQTIKISDSPGKEMGDIKVINKIKEDLNG
jgi:hypothetical protein